MIDEKNGIMVIENDFKSNFALNNGISDYLDNVDKSSSYPFEKLVAESLCFLFGKNILNGYFNNSYDEFINSFPEEIRIDIIDLISNLDEYNKMMNSINSNDSIIFVQEITDSILKSLCNICEFSDKNKEDLVNLFENSSISSDMNNIRDLIKINDSIENLNSRTI